MASELDGWVLAQVFFRSLFLQASWNPKGMQNLGMAFALYPALEKLYPQPQARQAAVERHLSFFNTHPYMAAAVLGGVLFHEQKVARGEAPPQTVTDFKAALMGPLAALGDGFFWLSLRPAVGAVAALLVPFLGLGAALGFLLAYNGVHLSMRALMFLRGCRRGEGVLEALSRARLPERGQRLRTVAAMAAGAASLMWALRWDMVAWGGQGAFWVWAGWGLLIAVLLRWAPRLNAYALLYGGVAVAWVAAMRFS